MTNAANKKESKKNNLGLAIAMGAGIGIIFGQFVFNNVGVGIAVGAGLGIAFASHKPNKDNNNVD